MKKVLLPALVILIVAAIAIYIFQSPIKKSMYKLIPDDMFVAADNDSFDPGPVIGSHFPGVRASYQGREISLLNPFAGTNGTVLVASRSVDWCPFCMKQMIQLNEHKASFDQAGIGLVAITYDDPQLQAQFAEKFDITIPMLSDIQAMSFKTLGIVNEQYQPGEHHYGIPYPGMIIIDSNGLVVGKLFLEGFSTRVDSAAALEFAKQLLNTDN